MSEAIQHLARTCGDVAEDLLSQPDFFSRHRQELPTPEQDVPALPVERYSGARSDDELTNLKVGAMRMLGFSIRAIERECGVDRRTIPHRLAWLERTGRIPAQKDRLLRLVGESAEKSSLVLSALLDRAAAGEVSIDLAGMIRSVATAQGITLEKVQLLTGAPTEIVEQRVGAGRAEIEQFWRSAAVVLDVAARPIDCDSTAEGQPPAISACPVPGGHGTDTPAVSIQSSGGGLDDGGQGPGARAGRGAGGVASGGGAGNGNGSTGSQNLSQGADGSAPEEKNT